jgi:transcription elongation GreA/GreB family factor
MKVSIVKSGYASTWNWPGNRSHQTMNDADAEENVSRIAQGRLRAAKEKQHRLELALKELKALQQQQSNSQRNSCQHE